MFYRDSSRVQPLTVEQNLGIRIWHQLPHTPWCFFFFLAENYLCITTTLAGILQKKTSPLIQYILLFFVYHINLVRLSCVIKSNVWSSKLNDYPFTFRPPASGENLILNNYRSFSLWPAEKWVAALSGSWHKQSIEHRRLMGKNYLGRYFKEKVFPWHGD